MNQEYKKFQILFNNYRLKAQFETLAQFGEALTREGFSYEDSMFSRWKNGDRMPKQRPVVLSIIKVFIKRNALLKSEEASEFLYATNQRQLTESEQYELFHTPSSFTYQSHIRPTPLSDEDATFLAHKILGSPFATIYKEKIKHLYALTKQDPHAYLKILQKVESRPSELDTIIRETQDNGMMIKDHISTSYLITFLKKAFFVRFSDRFVMH